MKLKIQKLIGSILDQRRWPALGLGVAPSIEHIEALSPLRLQTILDIGANKGQFSLLCHLLFPKARIIAFEPLEDAARICMQVMKGHSDFTLHQVALGTESGTANMFVTSQSDSSSLLKPGTAQENIFHSEVAGERKVSVTTLNDMLSGENIVSPSLLKMDVQGFELSVLKGGQEVLSLFDFIFAELSYVELYEGQPIASEIIQFLHERDFHLKGIFGQYVPVNGRPVQADFLFQRVDSTV